MTREIWRVTFPFQRVVKASICRIGLRFVLTSISSSPFVIFIMVTLEEFVA